MTRVILPNTSPYTAKDQEKSDRATCFIGRGSPRSSTAAYARAWGKLANKRVYNPDDVVFLSVEGARSHRLPLDTDELRRATYAGAAIITDSLANRMRSYNVGEREAAEFLLANGYIDLGALGAWVRVAPQSEYCDICNRYQCDGSRCYSVCPHCGSEVHDE